MYICNDCGHVFDEPGSIVERHPYGDTYAEEVFGCCPCCGCDDFEDAYKCESCGEYYALSDLQDDLCEECLKEFRKMLAKAIHDTFTKEEFSRIPYDILDYAWDDAEKLFNMDEGNK